MASGEASKKNDKKSTTSFDDLPHENAVEILVRLPVKSLMRSISVSKTWHSLIVNPNFISKQIQRSISCRDEKAVLIVPFYLTHENYCSLISSETCRVLNTFEIPFKTRTGTLHLVGSINGILCLSDYIEIVNSYRYLYLWNPSVRKFRCVFSSSFDQDRFYNRKTTDAVGFGFHRPTHDYRVVRVVYAGETYVPRVEVFSFRMNNWREIHNPGVCKVSATGFGTTVDNYVYWVDRVDTETHVEQVWIMSFDFNNEVFGQVKLPDDVSYCVGDSACFNLMKFEGSLAVCVSDLIRGRNGMLSQPCCIWLMSHDDDIVSWTLRFKVVLKEHVWPCDITRNGTLLMWSLSSPFTGLLSCNVNSKQDLGEPLFDKPDCTVDTSFIESLLLLEGGEQLLKSAK